ncbi:MAG: hypothetical protein ACTHMS_23505 [Jatrophihabitans sp.]|uniref:hypothetical protein n=1 Tax=Jatrophihabitans sp. TaxID=1932789 RepID=UPI003F7E31A3
MGMAELLDAVREVQAVDWDSLTPCCEVMHDPARRVRCDRPAAWILRTRCHCGISEITLLCDPCMEKVRRRQMRFTCDGCGCVNAQVHNEAQPLVPLGVS